MFSSSPGRDTQQLATRFAPPGRLERPKVTELSAVAREHPLVGVLLEAINGFVIILSRERQILAANHEVLEALQMTCQDDLVGFRPGEAFGCVHADTGPNGCGTADVCSACGCVRTILKCQQTGAVAEGECVLSMANEGQLTAAEFMIRATPIKVQDNEMIVAVLKDISDQKRRRVLERVLIHDLSNTIGALLGWSEMANRQDPRMVAEQISVIARQITEDFNAMRLLMEAERGGLQAHPRLVTVPEVFEDLRRTFSAHRAARDRKLIVFCGSEVPDVITDPRLLNQVLVNMTKNALEATPEGGKVRVWTEVRGDRIDFLVSNPGVMPDDTAKQVFQRTFTTKKHGLGLGTYSMKLFGEQYLGGKVSFTSNEPQGTRFVLSLPLKLPEA